MNIALSPRAALNLIETAVGKSGDIRDQKFKRVREEIFPAIHFALYLKRAGHGENLILSRDSPDISFVKAEDIIRNAARGSIPAFPMEITSIRDNDFQLAAGSDSSEKIVNILTLGKFQKRYEPQTILLVVIEVDTIFDPKRIAELISSCRHYFHQIWFKTRLTDTRFQLIQIYPALAGGEYDTKGDFQDIMY